MKYYLSFIVFILFSSLTNYKSKEVKIKARKVTKVATEAKSKPTTTLEAKLKSETENKAELSTEAATASKGN